jgi:hypothetical protein
MALALSAPPRPLLGTTAKGPIRSISGSYIKVHFSHPQILHPSIDRCTEYEGIERDTRFRVVPSTWLHPCYRLIPFPERNMARGDGVLARRGVNKGAFVHWCCSCCVRAVYRVLAG